MIRKLKISLLDQTVQPVKMIRKFFRKTRDYMRAYETGETEFSKIALAIKTYKSHRTAPPSESTLHKKYKPWEKKKAMKTDASQLLELFNSLFLADKNTSEHSNDTTIDIDIDAVAVEFANAMCIVNDDYDSDLN